MKHCLVFNYGSSTLKYAFFKGLRKLRTATLKAKSVEDCKSIVREVLRTAQRVDLIAHRVVHGMDMDSPMLIDHAGLQKLRELTLFAPLHNTLALAGVEVCIQELPHVPQYAIFDTSFFKDLPFTSRAYALPTELYQKGVKRYGFHGISYSYLLQETARLMKKRVNTLNLIMLHLGSGASVCAVQKGKPIDTSMGMTPLEGLVMSTRAGDLDPGVVLYLLKMGKTPEEVESFLYKECGIKGLTGDGDMRRLIEDARKGVRDAEKALSLYVYRIKKY
ncbi:MAG: acetate/propionate family kinase, partial [Acidobacteria bacterium]